MSLGLRPRCIWLTRLGGQRFVVVIGCGIVTSVLVWFGKIDPVNYSTVILGTVGVFIGAGAWQAAKTGKSAE